MATIKVIIMLALSSRRTSISLASTLILPQQERLHPSVLNSVPMSVAALRTQLHVPTRSVVRLSKDVLLSMELLPIMATIKVVILLALSSRRTLMMLVSTLILLQCKHLPPSVLNSVPMSVAALRTQLRVPTRSVA